MASATYVSSVRPPVNSARRRAAGWMSKRYFLASSCINWQLGALDGLAEVRVPDRGSDDKINLMAEESFERFLEIEVVIGVIGTRRSLELNQEVEVAQAWSVGSSSSGAEEVKPTDAVSPAKAGQFCVVENDVWRHG